MTRRVGGKVGHKAQTQQIGVLLAPILRQSSRRENTKSGQAAATVGRNVDSSDECTIQVIADHNHFDYVRYYTFRNTSKRSNLASDPKSHAPIAPQFAAYTKVAATQTCHLARNKSVLIRFQCGDCDTIYPFKLHNRVAANNHLSQILPIFAFHILQNNI
jgi:hypothetical protein